MKVPEGIRKAFHILSGVVLAVCLLRGCYWVICPLSRSESQVRKYVYKTVPYGTSWDEAVELLENSHFPKVTLFEDHGLCLNVYSGQVWIGDTQEHGTANIGEKSIYVHLGHYYNPLWTDVIAYLAFDDDKLSHIEIEYQIDSL